VIIYISAPAVRRCEALGACPCFRRALAARSLLSYTAGGAGGTRWYRRWAYGVAGGSNLTFESALDCLLTNAHDKAGHAAIRTVRRWVVLPIADLAWRLHLWCGVTLSREGGVSAALLCRTA